MVVNFEFEDDLAEVEYKNELLKKMNEIAEGKRMCDVKVDTNNEPGIRNDKKNRENINTQQNETEQYTTVNNNAIGNDIDIALTKASEEILNRSQFPENRFGISGLTDQQVYGVMDDYEQEMYGVMEQNQYDNNMNNDYEDSVNPFDYFSDGSW